MTEPIDFDALYERLSSTVSALARTGDEALAEDRHFLGIGQAVD